MTIRHEPASPVSVADNLSVTLVMHTHIWRLLPVLRQDRGYLPSCRASSTFDRYRIYMCKHRPTVNTWKQNSRESNTWSQIQCLTLWNKWSKNIFDKRPHRRIFHGGENWMWHRPGASLSGVLNDPFCSEDGRGDCVWMGRTIHRNCPFQWGISIPSNKCSLAHWVSPINGIAIDSAVFAYTAAKAPNAF